MTSKILKLKKKKRRRRRRRKQKRVKEKFIKNEILVQLSFMCKSLKNDSYFFDFKWKLSYARRYRLQLICFALPLPHLYFSALVFNLIYQSSPFYSKTFICLYVHHHQSINIYIYARSTRQFLFQIFRIIFFMAYQKLYLLMKFI